MIPTKDNTFILTKTEKFIRERFSSDGSGHDWWHIHRVRNLTLFIAEKEGGDLFKIELAALLHDLDDWKINKTESLEAENWLLNFELTKEEITGILKIIEQVSFKGAEVQTKATSIEAKIVQDADRLDAIGAIGIARTFAYGENKGRLIYDPNINHEMHKSFEEYKKNDSPTINHFYEKLLLLKDLMNTETAKKIAAKRHQIMEQFLNDFYTEWNFKP